jgi:predicted transcriptional regulator
MSAGFVEYVFPNTIPTSVDIWRVDLQMEICSECPDYCNDHPSDITVWINDVEIGTWTSPGDFGGTRGRLNPAWWHDYFNQFGMMKSWTVTREGTFLDGERVSDVTLEQVKVLPWQATKVRIGVKPEAIHQGGFSLFGAGFGNYEQDILLRLHYVAHGSLPSPLPNPWRPENPPSSNLTDEA